ncbi:sporulation protein [Candidatus Epulonipiscium viviparus]|uniref:sporulation protein n=1 Tax=Candidatus Epulonipiscium viviparus TaxID=420336 RepID=UPI00016C049C|nr:sporulation protein [Candidatus Epulopiscium viviparus]
MGVFANAFTAMSMGCAYVDTKVETKIIRQGEMIKGVVSLVGGKRAVEFRGIDVAYYTIYTKAHRATKLVETRCATAFTLPAGATEEVHFSLRISPDTPTTRFAYLKTIFDLPVPKEIKTNLKVFPSKDLEKIINILTTKFAYNNPTTETYLTQGQLVQRFTFKSKNLFGKFIDELQCYFLHVTGGIEMVMRIDKHARSFQTVLNEISSKNQTHINVFIPPYDETQTLERYLVKGR